MNMKSWSILGNNNRSSWDKSYMKEMKRNYRSIITDKFLLVLSPVVFLLSQY